MKFFTDAVLAIATTLLILPLLGVQKAADDGVSTREFLHDNGDQLFSFALSFVIIANFWVSHERLFNLVGQWTGRLMVLNVSWMLTIVFLPVATAMVGSMEPDRLQIVIYVGTMMLSSVLMAAMNLVVRRYLALFVLFLTGPPQAVIERRFGRHHRRPVARSTS